MDIDDLEPRAQRPKPKDLTGFSIEELKEYISRLEAEILRARETITAKEAGRKGAESFFKR